MKKNAIILFSALALLSCSKLDRGGQKTVAPMKVEVLTVGLAADASERCYVGEVESETALPVSHPLGGRLTELLVRNGDRVHKGQLLGRIDDTQARSLHEAAAATLRQAQDGYDRLRAVHEGGGVSDVRWVQMQTDLEKARQQEIITAKQLEDCRLTAPQDGVVSGLDVSAGQQLLPGQRVCNLIDANRLQVRFSVPEQEVMNIRKGDTVSVVLSALPDRIWTARVTDKDVSAGAVAHTYGVRAQLQERCSDILPGMVAKVTALRMGGEGIVVPAECVQTTQQGLAVWVAVEGRAERRLIGDTEFVRTGVRVGQGLLPGDRVITSGYQKLYNGCEIAE